MLRPLTSALALIVAGCASTPTPAPPTPSAPPSGVPTGLPSVAEAPSDHPAGAPLVLPFTAEAGQIVAVRAEGDPAPVLCIGSEAMWDRYTTGAGEANPADLAGDALECAGSGRDSSSTLAEVVPRSGRYVLVATDGAGETPRPFRLGEAPEVPTADPLPEGTAVPDSLGRSGAWSAPGRATHFVRGREGTRLSVEVASPAFAPYVEVGVWAGDAYTPLVGEGGDSTATVSVVLPADGVYTLRVEGTAGPYTVRATQAAPIPWAERFPAGGDPAERYALIVSVADYPGVGREQSADLVGPRADAEAVRALLVEAFAFRPENVLVLRDAEATREAVTEAFRRHLGQAGDEGTAFFHYAGHGTQLPTEALGGTAQPRTEADGLDEALVLWGRGADFSFLLDHELGALAEGLGAGHTVLALDNCHSGDGTRGEGGTAALRLLPFKEMVGRVTLPDDLAVGANVGATRHVLLAAARDEQPSLELEGLAPDGGRAGVFTTALVDALREAGPDATFAEVLERVRPRVERMTRTEMGRYGYLPQAPQVEGAQADVRVDAALSPRE